MRITIQVTCDSDEEARKAIDRLTRKHDTWVEMSEKEAVPPKSSTAVPDTGIPASVRENISPGEPGIGKIGAATKDHILAELKLEDRLAAHFGTKYFEHLKLLWVRGEIKFDGTVYYL
jgi:hypothetical protein